jgi:hypothetical protein
MHIAHQFGQCKTIFGTQIQFQPGIAGNGVDRCPPEMTPYIQRRAGFLGKFEMAARRVTIALIS